jgi:hypothetical protein
MKKIFFILVFFNFLSSKVTNASPAQFWEQQKRGANFFNKLETSNRLQEGRNFGLQFVRLAPSKWQSTGRDFLLGDAGQYKTIPQADLERLKFILDEANEAGVKILLTSLSSPGSRWRQQNGMQWDCRLYRDGKYVAQLSRFWEDLTRAIGNHPSLVGVDPINEPYLSKCAPAKISLDEIYRAVVSGIRRASTTLPVVIESDNFADVQTFTAMPYFEDKNVFYSFHMYEPFDFTNLKLNQGRYRYPGVIPMSETANDKWRERVWNKKTSAEYLMPVVDWQSQHKVPSNRIVAAEFGCNRVVKGCQQYLSDLIDSFNERGWHWSFYSFREDTWPSMDYELGAKRLTEAQWKLLEVGGTLEYPSDTSEMALMLKDKVKGR